MRIFSVARWWGIVTKEFLQLHRDRLTFGMVVGMPIIMLIVFGYAINTDPRHLHTAVLRGDQSEFTRSYLAAMKTSGYFEFVRELESEEDARAALARGDVQFVVNIPADFTRRLLRGERPAMLIEADATDPAAAGAAIASVRELALSVSKKDLKGALAPLAAGQAPFEVRVHKLYNPEGLTQHNIVPGLMGVILTMTMVMMTGKIVPYIFIGLIQITIIMLAAVYLFGVPFVGSVLVLYTVALLFIAAQLTIGITISSLAQNQLQAMQMTFFYFLPTMLLSGFMFPFQGMPGWAQVVGGVLPATYFMRLVRGILLKGNDWPDLWTNIWPIMVFTVVVMSIALIFYRRTLD